MRITRVQYTVQADFVEQNKRNIEAVMADLRALNPADFTYASYLLEDGRTFMHFVHESTANTQSLPTSLDSFKHFQAELKDHVEVPPKAESLSLVAASYEMA